ncbi:MAG: hypothetical protein TR69_WS6001000762 [candidate division WS6 bacterium OLB20]|uniref:Uncharacterized protein n=1 Tax=candidate division WS6 bacterium OLB20 TaxID=1617426 RepID=A0A136LYM3_9BACT|nr:MAG: hypothetical protein TR69_WS6001000762 [candidate division WS6 bacterium OLB20]
MQKEFRMTMMIAFAIIIVFAALGCAAKTALPTATHEGELLPPATFASTQHLPTLSGALLTRTRIVLTEIAHATETPQPIIDGLDCGGYPLVGLRTMGQLVPVRLVTRIDGISIGTNAEFEVYDVDFGFCAISWKADSNGTIFVLGFGVLRQTQGVYAGWVNALHIELPVQSLPEANSWVDYFAVVPNR